MHVSIEANPLHHKTSHAELKCITPFASAALLGTLWLFFYSTFFDLIYCTRISEQ